MNEATARIKINRQLERAGWRFFPEGDELANISLEPNVRLEQSDLDALGDDFEQVKRGFIDFLLLDSKGFPLVVFEAKSENKNPLTGKEQARKYARSQKCRFVILSNGNLHYFWDLERGNPHIITSFPTPESVTGYARVQPDPKRLIDEQVSADYIVLTQRPNYASEAAWKNEAERDGFKRANKLRFLRDYQLKAVHTLQRAVKYGADRFLFEMATGTGKTLTAAAVIKLFLRSRNASRAYSSWSTASSWKIRPKRSSRLSSRRTSKRSSTKRIASDWRKRRDSSLHGPVLSVRQQIPVTLLTHRLRLRDLRRSAPLDQRQRPGGVRLFRRLQARPYRNATRLPERLRPDRSRTVRDPREVERRLLRDTYRTFGCESGEPTFRYSLLDGVRDGYLVNPTVVDARTDVTTQLLSDKGFVVSFRRRPART